MSAFGNYNKDEVVRTIEELIQAEGDAGRSMSDIIESVMEAVTCGIKYGIYEHLKQAGKHGKGEK
jgi:hypothetical protein